jgi:hypothetical protein
MVSRDRLRARRWLHGVRYGSEQFEKPLVAPMPLMPNSLVVETVPCLRSPIPVPRPLPDVVFPEMLRQRNVSPEVDPDPDSTRIPYLLPLRGEAAVLFWILASRTPFQLVVDTQLLGSMDRALPISERFSRLALSRRIVQPGVESNSMTRHMLKEEAQAWMAG